MREYCETCNNTGKDAVGNPCRDCAKKSIEKPDLTKNITDFDLRK